MCVVLCVAERLEAERIAEEERIAKEKAEEEARMAKELGERQAAEKEAMAAFDALLDEENAANAEMNAARGRPSSSSTTAE